MRLNPVAYHLVAFIAKWAWASFFIYLWIVAVGWIKPTPLYLHTPFVTFVVTATITTVIALSSRLKIS